jgi:uncharacterized membrane protein YedE/YeeE
MKRELAALAAGALFGVGLAVAQMTDPLKVLGFLDLAGDWDPSLALVMGGAVVVGMLGFRMVTRGRKPLFDERFFLPTARDIDLPLVAGSAIFGVGWGLAGYCPGPALAAISNLSLDALLFVAAMLAGMFAYRMWSNTSPASQAVKD